jgi:hypothetical protein
VTTRVFKGCCPKLTTFKVYDNKLRRLRPPGLQDDEQAGVPLDREAAAGAARGQLLQRPVRPEEAAAAALPDQEDRPERVRRPGRPGQAGAAHQPGGEDPAGHLQEPQEAGGAAPVGEQHQELHGRGVQRADQSQEARADREQDQFAQRREDSGEPAQAGEDRGQADALRVRQGQVDGGEDPGEQHRDQERGRGLVGLVLGARRSDGYYVVKCY